MVWWGMDTIQPVTAADRERQRIAALDDATVARMHAMSPSPALADEIGRRQQFERQWAKPWSSGPDTRVPPCPPEYRHLIECVARDRYTSRSKQRSREEIRRSEYLKLLKQARSRNKVEREAAQYILNTCYKSRS